MPTTIANLWVPQVWIRGAREGQVQFPVIWNSGAVIETAEARQLAEGPGINGNLPFFHNISTHNDEIQVENTPPSDQVITAGVQLAAIFNRVTKFSATALSGAVSGTQPVAEITAQIGEMRAMQRQRTMTAELRGLFGTGTGVAIGAAAALSAVRRVAADESGVGAAATEIMSPELIIETRALMGELGSRLETGAIYCHPDIRATLEKVDTIGFQTGVASGLPFSITTYRGMPLFVSDTLVRAGTTDGFVYDTYLLGRGVFAKGEKPQVPDTGNTIDVATLQYFANKDPNNELLWDRTRFVLHPNGMRFIGTPAGQSATNVELSIPASWSLVYASAKLTGMACIVTNG